MVEYDEWERRYGKLLMSGQRSISKNDWTCKQRTTGQGYEGMSEENDLSNQATWSESILVTNHEGDQG
jgi:hypothetical protein